MSFQVNIYHAFYRSICWKVLFAESAGNLEPWASDFRQCSWKLVNVALIVALGIDVGRFVEQLLLW